METTVSLTQLYNKTSEPIDSPESRLYLRVGGECIGLCHQPVRLPEKVATRARTVELPTVESRGLLPVLQVCYVRLPPHILRRWQRFQVYYGFEMLRITYILKRRSRYRTLTHIARERRRVAHRWNSAYHIMLLLGSKSTHFSRS